MADKKLDYIEIHPAVNGGHTIRHNFKPQPSKRGQDVFMDRPREEEHVFGAGEDHKVLTHIAQALGMKKVAAEEAREDRGGGEK